MKYLFLFLFCLNAHASKILFDLNGQQYLHDLGPGGNVTKDATVLWDERVDGPLPSDAPVGYADRVVNLPQGTVSLVPNPTKKAAFDAAAAAVTQAASDKAALVASIKALKAKLKAKTATAADVRDALAALLDALNLGN